MSYDSARESLQQLRDENGSEPTPRPACELIEAMEHLVNAVETDMTQLKMALSYVAQVLEQE